MSEVSDVERHHLAHDLTPMGRYTYRGVDYVVAIGGPFEVWYPTTENETWFWKHCPLGYYEFAWTILRDAKPWIAGTSVIDRYHDMDKGWTEEARERARLNAARQHCERAIDDGIARALETDT